MNRLCCMKILLCTTSGFMRSFYQNLTQYNANLAVMHVPNKSFSEWVPFWVYWVSYICNPALICWYCWLPFNNNKALGPLPKTFSKRWKKCIKNIAESAQVLEGLAVTWSPNQLHQVWKVNVGLAVKSLWKYQFSTNRHS